MNWEAIGAVGEILGALGVIISLGYLAGQIRGNTRALRRTASHDAVSGLNHWFAEVTRSTEFAATFSRGLEGFGSLSPEEASWFRIMLFQFFKVAEDMHFQYVEGVLDDGQWEGWSFLYGQYLASPGGREYWALVRPMFSPGFRAFYETLQPSDSFERVGAALESRAP